MVLCGSAYRNRGVEPLLDAAVAYLPSPAGRPGGARVRSTARRTPRRRSGAADPAGAVRRYWCSRSLLDRHSGGLTYLRVYSGTIVKGERRCWTRAKPRSERIGRILRVQADRHAEALDRAVAGDIVALIGPKAARAGATLCATGCPRCCWSRSTVADPVVSVALRRAGAPTPTCLTRGLGRWPRWCEEDPTFQVRTDRRPARR